MNTLSMPGFTAEAALYRTKGHYRMMGSTGAKGNGTIQPAFCVCLISCSLHYGCRKSCHCEPDLMATEPGYVPDPDLMDETSIPFLQ